MREVVAVTNASDDETIPKDDYDATSFDIDAPGRMLVRRAVRDRQYHRSSWAYAVEREAIQPAISPQGSLTTLRPPSPRPALQ